MSTLFPQAVQSDERTSTAQMEDLLYKGADTVLVCAATGPADSIKLTCAQSPLHPQSAADAGQ